MAQQDAPKLIEQAVRAFLEEVPALKPLKLVVRVDLLGSSPIDLVLLGSRAVLQMTTDSKIGTA